MQEVWKNIKGYEGLYQISNLGRIKSLPRNGTKPIETIKKTTVDKYGYLRVSLSNKNKRKKVLVHRLVAQAFISNPQNKPQVNHIDGNKKNNVLENLEWCTNSENMKHAYKIGLETTEQAIKNLGKYAKRGKDNPKSKRVLQYDLDGNFIKEWESMNQIERELGYRTQNICSCCQGKYKKAFNFIWRYKIVE